VGWIYLAAVLIVVGGVLARMAWLARHAEAPLLVLKPPVTRFEKLPAADVDALRARADARRQAAAATYRATISNTFDRS
jgi:hypothetical protein